MGRTFFSKNSTAWGSSGTPRPADAKRGARTRSAKARSVRSRWLQVMVGSSLRVTVTDHQPPVRSSEVAAWRRIYPAYKGADQTENPTPGKGKSTAVLA